MTANVFVRVLIRVALFSVVGVSLTWIFLRSSFSVGHAIETISIFLILNIIYELGAHLFRGRPGSLSGR